MIKMNTLQDIMTKDPICLSEHANVHKARMLMAEKSIRHIPIKDIDSDRLIGMLSQKAVLSNAIKIINHRGFEKLQHEEKSAGISSIMNNSPAIFDIEDSIVGVAKNLLEQKSGCVAITENSKLVGVITSNDFVKLTVNQTDLSGS